MKKLLDLQIMGEVLYYRPGMAVITTNVNGLDFIRIFNKGEDTLVFFIEEEILTQFKDGKIGFYEVLTLVGAMYTYSPDGTIRLHQESALTFAPLPDFSPEKYRIELRDDTYTL